MSSFGSSDVSSSTAATYDLSDLPGQFPGSGGGNGDTRRVPTTATLKTAVGHAAVVDSMRRLLLSSGAPMSTGPSIVQPALLVTSRTTTVVKDDWLSKYDSIKLATFRHAKLGLSLVRVSACHINVSISFSPVSHP